MPCTCGACPLPRVQALGHTSIIVYTCTTATSTALAVDHHRCVGSASTWSTSQLIGNGRHEFNALSRVQVLQYPVYFRKPGIWYLRPICAMRVFSTSGKKNCQSSYFVVSMSKVKQAFVYRLLDLPSLPCTEPLLRAFVHIDKHRLISKFHRYRRSGVTAEMVRRVNGPQTLYVWSWSCVNGPGLAHLDRPCKCSRAVMLVSLLIKESSFLHPQRVWVSNTRNLNVQHSI